MTIGDNGDGTINVSNQSASIADLVGGVPISPTGLRFASVASGGQCDYSDALVDLSECLSECDYSADPQAENGGL